MFAKLRRLFSFKNKQEPEVVLAAIVCEKNPMEIVDDLRQKMTGLGWALTEIPVRNGNNSVNIIGWKIVAVRGDRSFTLSGNTLVAAMKSMAKMLGVIR